MGFGRRRVKEAFRSVGSKLETALSWLLHSASTEHHTDQGANGNEAFSQKARRFSGPFSCMPHTVGTDGSPAHATPPCSPNGERCYCALLE